MEPEPNITGLNPGGATEAVAAATRCEEGGPDLPVVQVQMSNGETLDFLLIACRSQALVDLSLDGVQQAVQSDGNGGTRYTSPPLARGPHTLAWMVTCNAEDWQTRTDISVGNELRFRHRRNEKKHDSPYQSFVLVEVV